MKAITHKDSNRTIWRSANIRLVPAAILLVGGALIASYYGNVSRANADQKLFSFYGLLAFILFSVIFLRVLTKAISLHVSPQHFGTGRVAAIQFVLRIVGYTAVFFLVLSLLHIPIANLLLGSAALGIILGVAAQQALGNLFASIVLIIAHPFSVGDEVVIISGAMGGNYAGTIRDVGLTHTKLLQKSGHVILLPNVSVLSGSAIQKENAPH